jgi:hypothetical protein
LEEWLHNGSFKALSCFKQGFGIGRHDRLGHEVGSYRERPKLFVRNEQAIWIINNACFRALGALEHLQRCDEVIVDRWVLAHPYELKITKRFFLPLIDFEMTVGNSHRASMREPLSALHDEISNLALPDFIASRLAFEHNVVGRVCVLIDFVDGIHDKKMSIWHNYLKGILPSTATLNAVTEKENTKTSECPVSQPRDSESENDALLELITDESSLEGVFTQFEKPRASFRIGVEHERFVVDPQSLTPIPWNRS